MEPFVVSDINSWSAFFSKLLEVHSSLRGSALNKAQKTQTWNLKLINTAVTIDKHGRKFPYFQAVDLGRAPVTTRFSGFIAFAGTEGARITTHETRSAFGYNITAQATAKINTTFDAELHQVLNQWFEKHSEGELLRLARVRPQQAARRNNAQGARGGRVHRQNDAEFRQAGLSIVGEGASVKELDDADRFLLAAGVQLGAEGEIVETPILAEGEAVEEDVSSRRIGRIVAAREKAYNATFTRLLNKSGITFNAREIIRLAEVAGEQAAAKEANRVALLRSGIVNKAAFKPILGAAQNNPAIQKLVKISNWYVLAAIFSKVTGDQIENVWKPLTPSRRETGNFKLVYLAGGSQAILTPKSGGSLINGYKLVTNNELQRIIGEGA